MRPLRPGRGSGSMATLEKYLDQLERFKVQFAVQALERPSQKDSYEYGYVTGTVAGINHALRILNEVLKGDEK